MLITGVLSLAVAVLLLTLGVRALRQPAAEDPELLVRRAIAPAQVAAGALLGIAGAAAIGGPQPFALLTVFICVTGALATLAGGAWQGAQYSARVTAAGSSAPESRGASGGGCAGGDCGCAGGAAEAAVPEHAPSRNAEPAQDSIPMPERINALLPILGQDPGPEVSVGQQSGGCCGGGGCCS